MPVIVLPKLLIHGLVELDGYRSLICGRTGEQILLSHTYQLATDSERTKYIKALIKYFERCAAAKRELPATSYDIISKEGNEDIYSFLIEKLSLPQYANIPSVLATIKTLRTNFSALSLLAQCKALIEILHALQCNRTLSDLSAIGGKSKVGVLVKSKNISNLSSAVLVNQSVTGLFETRVDLLK